MELTTRINIPKNQEHISHSNRLLLLGSCFADEIGTRLRRDKFDAMVNPFGTLYNPASICAHLLRSLSEREYDANSPELIESESVWHSWMHHSTFSCDDRDELVSRMNTALHTTAERLRTTDWLLLTFGTSYVYRLKANDLLVANCHKQPDALFVRQRMAAYDIVDMFTTALQLMQAVNPKLHVVLTVSPIRHSRDGMHENQLSKAELLLATDALSKRSTLNSQLYYFPAYELLLDELRDYRFYGDDLVHPSALAADYIYERFCDTFVTPDEQALSAQCRQIQRALEHRPFRADSPQHRQFISKTYDQIQQLTAAHPCLDMAAEIALCNTLLKK